MEAGPFSKEKRCCITVGYERNALANVVVMQHNTEAGDERDVTSLDATHDGGGPISKEKRCCITAIHWATKGMR